MRDATPFYEATGHEIEVFERAWRHGLPVLLKGPTGCGKTRFVQYMARRLELPLYSLNTIVGVNKRVKGLEVPGDIRFRFLETAVE